MPTRPSQTDPERLDRWRRARQKVGARIRQLRLEAGLSQESLALESGLSRNQLIQLEHGHGSVLFERLLDIADALDCPPSAVFESSESSDESPASM